MNASRPPEPADGANLREQLSSFVDGECQSPAADDVCRRWRTDAECRSTWHAYHLIGDVLRSDELATSDGREAAFLSTLRERLAAEPVPLAPAPLPGQPVRPLRSKRWYMPAAAVAGFMAVGVAVVALRPEATATGWNERIAATPPSGQGDMRRVGSVAAPASAQMMVVDGQLIRDARLDAYFEAHRGAAGAGPSALPGGALRSVEILVPQR